MSLFRNVWTLLFLLAGTVGCSRDEVTPPERAEAETPGQVLSGVDSPSAVMLRPVVIPDAARNNMLAFRLLVPEGWAVEGGITAVPPGYHMIPYRGDVTIEAPDKRGVRFFGINEFGYADGVQLPHFAPYQGRPFFPLKDSLGAFWMDVFQMAPAPGVTRLQVVSEDVLPDATEMVRQQLADLYRATAQENAQLAMTGEQVFFDVHVRRLVVTYDDNGTSVEATIFATVRHQVYLYPNGMIRAAMWNLDNMYAVFGPVGTDYLNDPLLASIVRSRQAVPEWQVAVQRWYLMKNQQIVAEGQARIAAAAQAAASSQHSQSQDVLDISFNGWKKRNSMNDAGHSAAVKGIHERTTYATPSGSTVDLSSHYQNVYTDQLGNYVLHNDANYEINTDPTFNGRQWQRIEPVE